MEKKKISVFVAGQKLTLITTETERYVSDIASKVDTAINSLFTSSNMSREKCAVMAALDFCDDEAKSRAALNEIKEQIKEYIIDSDKLRKENEALKAEVEKLKGEKAELLKSKKTLIATAVEIKKDNKPQEKTEDDTQISSDDDLSFDYDDAVNKEPQTASDSDSQATVNNYAVADAKVAKNAPKADKKRHNHEHKNPYKERFLQQEEKKGYSPVRQYSLFDDNN